MYKKYYIPLVLCISAYVYQLGVKFNLINSNWFVKNHLSDLLCLPIILSIALLLIRKLKRWPYFYLSNGMVITSFISTSIIFEGILPTYDKKYTADILDVLFYCMGGLIFYAIQEQLKKEEKFKTSVNLLKQ
jgi:uncharacterized membrane protein AbrB (regulator of aidB expression)